MSGIAIIIHGADYSQNNIGTITRKQTPLQIVNAYLADVGGDASYRQKLVTLYETLDALGVLETLDIFPMIGNSVANKCKGFGPTAYFSTLKTGANASNGTVGIDFVNTVAPAFSDVSTYNSNLKFDDMYVFVSAKRSGSNGQSILAKAGGGGNSMNGWDIYSRYFPESGDTRRKIEFIHSSSTMVYDTDVDCNNAFVDVSGWVDGTNLYYMTNGTQNASGAFSNALTADWNMNNAIGGDYYNAGSGYPSAQKEAYGGTVRMYAMGYVPTDMVTRVDSALRTFLS